MNRDDYAKLVNPYSFELRNIYDDTFGHRRHLEDMLGVRSPFQSAVERAAFGLEDATRLDAIACSKTRIQEELERISGSATRAFLGDGIYAGVMSHAEEMAKIQEPRTSSIGCRRWPVRVHIQKPIWLGECGVRL